MRLPTFFGYAAAALMIPVALATFLGMDFFGHKLVEATGITVSPWYTGGEIVKAVDHGPYQMRQHRAVFDGLIGQKAEGFVQIDWTPLGALPGVIVEEVDYDLDGVNDFKIEYDTAANTAVITPYNDKTASLAGCYKLKERQAIRVNLHNK